MQNAKQDVSGLKLEQLLRKDAKVLQIDDINIALCAFPFLTVHLLEKYQDIGDQLLSLCTNYHAVILLGIEIDPVKDSIQRDLIVFSGNTSLKIKVSTLK